MGFRDYSPGLNRFLTRDSYNGALADMHLGLNTFTGNRYAFGGGNPISSVENDGHIACEGAYTCDGNDGGGAGPFRPDATGLNDPYDGPGSGANPSDGPSGSGLGIHQAAWCGAQVGSDCTLGFDLGDQAEKRARELSKNQHWTGGQQNAFRHAYWMGLLTANGFSYENAIALGEAHEKDGDTPRQLWGSEDSRADLHQQ